MSKVKNLSEIKVMYLKANGAAKDVSAKLFTELESKFKSLNGRKMYGVYYKNKNEYWACSTILVDDDPEKMGLLVGHIPGGKYAFEKLEGPFNEIIKMIGPAYNKLVKENKDNIDSNRPDIEFYERHTKFILLLPIVS